MNSQAKMGFTYYLKLTHPDGRVEYDKCRNLIPTEGLNHLMAVGFKGSQQTATWFIALYEGNYTPQPTDTAATFPANATECTAYTPGTRPEFIEGAVSAGSVDNSANLATYVFTAAKTVYGAAMLSSSVKGGVSGVLVSIARFSSPKIVEPGAKLEVLGGNTLISA